MVRSCKICNSVFHDANGCPGDGIDRAPIGTAVAVMCGTSLGLFAAVGAFLFLVLPH